MSRTEKIVVTVFAVGALAIVLNDWYGLVYGSHRSSGQDVECGINLVLLSRALRQYREEHGQLPATLEELGSDPLGLRCLYAPPGTQYEYTPEGEHLVECRRHHGSSPDWLWWYRPVIYVIDRQCEMGIVRQVEPSDEAPEPEHYFGEWKER